MVRAGSRSVPDVCAPQLTAAQTSRRRTDRPSRRAKAPECVPVLLNALSAATTDCLRSSAG
eukprot:7243487-Prymnesium_polylepis.2